MAASNVSAPKEQVVPQPAAPQPQDTQKQEGTHSPVSLASFYDSQDVYNPLQEGVRPKTLDLSGDSTVAAQQPLDAQKTERQPPTWWASLLAWWKGTPAEKPQPVKKKAALLGETKVHKQVISSKQNSSVTALAAFDDSQHTISISESFGDLERQDEDDQERVEHEDATARTDAQTQEAVPKESPEQLKNRQVHISNVFSALEEEDDQIQSSLQNTDDLSEYSRLSNLQDTSMSMLSAELSRADKIQRAPRPLLKRDDRSFEAKQMHDPWRALEKQDLETESRVKRNPSLRLLQKSDTVERHH